MAEKIVFVPNPAGWQYEFHSWAGVVGRDTYRRTTALHVLSSMTAPAPGRRPRNRTGINYATGLLASTILKSRAKWGNEVEGRVIALPRHAIYVHEGTVPHIILPKRAGGWLRFFSHKAGRVIYARKVRHPGTRANPFMAEHLRTVVKVL